MLVKMIVSLKKFIVFSDFMSVKCRPTREIRFTASTLTGGPNKNGDKQKYLKRWRFLFPHNDIVEVFV